MNVFISYSRLTSETATQLARKLEEIHNVWLDVTDLPGGWDWWEEIKAAIDRSEVIVFLLSPSFCLSPFCLQELTYADELKKRLIPVVIGNIPTPPASLARLEWISLSNWEQQKGWEEGVQELIKAIDERPEDVKAHTELLLLARAWKSREDKSYLLRGNRLKEAIHWIETSDDRRPVPLQLHREFISKSRHAQHSEQLLVFLCGIALALISVIGCWL